MDANSATKSFVFTILTLDLYVAHATQYRSRHPLHSFKVMAESTWYKLFGGCVSSIHDGVAIDVAGH
jgi:hypothetical protein